ncbi:flavodoxin domain-containing protein [Facklamia sp. P12945]|uniref:flavodoxin domain-containing protein n=1 Tax=unclassified Facklamia TaxID=2622293 RepID=UPI003D169192
MKSLIIYESPYGSTLIYARALQRVFDFPMVALSEVDRTTLNHYDLIIVGTFVFSGRIFKSTLINQLMNRYREPSWVLFTVGISTPNLTNFTKLLKETFTARVYQQLATFHYRGRIASKRFSLMYLASKRMKRQPGTSLDDVILGPEEWHLLDYHGGTAEKEDLKQIANMVEYIREIVQYIG